MNFPSPNSIWPIDWVVDKEFAARVPDCLIYQLDNGLRVVVMQGEKDRSSFFKMYVNAGTIHQTAQKRGVAHFTEHMVFQGTEAFPSWKEMIEHAEEFNLGWNGSTGKSRQEFYVESDNDNESLHAALHHLTQIVFHARIPEDKVEKEKSVILSERQTGMSDPDDVFAEIYQNHFYDESHPFAGGGTLGSDADINSFSHQDAVDFYKSHFHPANMLLLVSGGESVATYQKLIEQYFAGYKSDLTWGANPVLGLHRQTDKLITEVPKDFNHVNLDVSYYLAKPEVLDSPSVEQVALRIAARALSTRLFLDIRDKQGLAYSAWANLDNVSGLGFTFSLGGEFPKDKYAKGRAELERYSTELFRNPVTQEEFKRAHRRFISTRWARGAREIADLVADWVFHYGQPISPEGWHQFYYQLTVDKVNEVVHDLLQDKPLEVVAVGLINKQ